MKSPAEPGRGDVLARQERMAEVHAEIGELEQADAPTHMIEERKVELHNEGGGDFPGVGPGILRNEEGRFREIVQRDTATFVGNEELRYVSELFDFDRKLIGFRVYDKPASPSDLPAREAIERALQFYATEWLGNAEGDPSTPGLLRTWMEPTDKLFEDEGAKAREALAALQPLSQGNGEAVGWREMETAPKDETRILLKTPSGALFVGSWRKDINGAPLWMTDSGAQGAALYIRPDGWLPLYAAPPSQSEGVAS